MAETKPKKKTTTSKKKTAAAKKTSTVKKTTAKKKTAARKKSTTVSKKKTTVSRKKTAIQAESVSSPEVQNLPELNHESFIENPPAKESYPVSSDTVIKPLHRAHSLLSLQGSLISTFDLSESTTEISKTPEESVISIEENPPIDESKIEQNEPEDILPPSEIVDESPRIIEKSNAVSPAHFITKNPVLIRIDWNHLEPRRGHIDYSFLKDTEAHIGSIKKEGHPVYLIPLSGEKPDWWNESGGWKSERNIENFAHSFEIVVLSLMEHSSMILTLDRPAEDLENYFINQKKGSWTDYLFSRRALAHQIQAHTRAIHIIERVSKTKKKGDLIFGAIKPVRFIYPSRKEKKSDQELSRSIQQVLVNDWMENTASGQVDDSNSEINADRIPPLIGEKLKPLTVRFRIRQARKLFADISEEAVEANDAATRHEYFLETNNERSSFTIIPQNNTDGIYIYHLTDRAS